MPLPRGFQTARVGAATTYFALELRTDLSGDAEREASHNDDAGWLAPRLFIPASMATLILGVLTAIEGDWNFGSLWIIIGLAGFGVSFATGIGYFAPEIKKLAAAMERGGATDPEVRRRVANLKMSVASSSRCSTSWWRRWSPSRPATTAQCSSL